MRIFKCIRKIIEQTASKTELSINHLSLIIICVSFSGCGLYSFTGGSITPGMKTVSVPLFENNAPLVVPTLSQAFTETLKDRIRTQSSLSFVKTDGQANFQGRITGYEIRPVSLQGNESGVAGQTRLTITVQVKYNNNIKPDDNFDQSFSRFRDFKGSLAAQEQQLIKDINLQLSEDIYNRAFASW